MIRLAKSTELSLLCPAVQVTNAILGLCVLAWHPTISDVTNLSETVISAIGVVMILQLALRAFLLHP